MPDAVQQSFVRSFIDYLKKQLDVMSPDQSESIEVAIQCLQTAFDVGDEDPEQLVETSSALQTESSADGNGASAGDAVASSSQATTSPVNTKVIDMFELFQSLYVERNPESLALAESIKNEGNRLMKEGKFNEALLQYNRAITFDPKNPIFYCNRAAAHIRLGDNARAVTDCKSALLYNVNYSKAYSRLGVAYSNLNKFAEAEQAYAKAIELEPDNADYRNNLEVVRNARNNQLQPTLEMLEGIRNLFPNTRNFLPERDADLLQDLTQNPIVMNAMRQLFSSEGQAPNVVQMFQNIVTQLASGQQPGAESPGAQQPGNQPPPST